MYELAYVVKPLKIIIIDILVHVDLYLRLVKALVKNLGVLFSRALKQVSSVVKTSFFFTFQY